MRHNKACGRAIHSKVDLDVYCPTEVLQQSGPLFGDHDSIQESLDSFLGDKALDIKLNTKCAVCGFPKCTCIVCVLLQEARDSGKKTKATQAHSCALQFCNLGAPSKQGPYDKEMFQQLQIAWQEHGVMEGPKYVRGKGWYFPEELE